MRWQGPSRIRRRRRRQRTSAGTCSGRVCGCRHGGINKEESERIRATLQQTAAKFFPQQILKRLWCSNPDKENGTSNKTFEMGGSTESSLHISFFWCNCHCHSACPDIGIKSRLPFRNRVTLSWTRHPTFLAVQ